jgi:phage repressor protein C with HTH and peptisase S24 domain
MNENLADRIDARRKELKLSIRGLGLKSGLPESTIRNVLNGTSDNPRGDTLTKLAFGLDVTEQWLLTSGTAAEDTGVAPPNGPGNVRFADVPFPAIGQLPKDVPVLGTVAGSELGKGAFQLSPDVVDYVRRPFGLIGIGEIYALYVEGESMSPKFEPGDLVFVHPARKARNGDYVVVQEPDNNNGEARGFIKRLIAVTTKLVRTEQFNPKATLDFVIRPGLKVHKVMTDGELYGI